ncbi:hypothetical protein Q5752_004632 [Cryptotrichosporon argae]
MSGRFKSNNVRDSSTRAHSRGRPTWDTMALGPQMGKASCSTCITSPGSIRVALSTKITDRDRHACQSRHSPHLRETAVRDSPEERRLFC